MYSHNIVYIRTMLPPSVSLRYTSTLTMGWRNDFREFSQSAVSGGDGLKLKRAKAEEEENKLK